jgi:hypothetical protein
MYLDPVYEYNNLLNWITPLIDQLIQPRLFVQRLRRQLNKRHSLRVRLISNVDNLEIDDFAIGAEYDPDLDQQHRKQIIINLFINHPKIIPWHITKEIADRFILELTETLVHEYQHQKQYRSRRYKIHKEQYVSKHRDLTVKNEQEYLGNPDEIDAYAANIAARARILKLNTGANNIDSIDQSLDLQNYIRVFGPKHKIVKTLLSKVLEYIEHLETPTNNKKKSRTVSKRKT